jgi:acyl-coenzyme A synthetase/AMP-(fatty) acid ligase
VKDLLHQSFEQAVALCPAAVAVDAPDARLSFAGLDARSEQVARRLPGCAAAPVIGILLPPSTAFYMALVACMKAARVAIPLDPAMPDRKLAEMTADSGVRHVLTDADGQARAQALGLAAECLRIEGPVPADSPDKRAHQGVSVPIEALHRILTSGSSGAPTTVTIGREAEVVHAREMGEAYGHRPGMLVANLARHTSGAGMNGFWRALLNSVGLMSFDLRRESLAQVYGRLQQARPTALQGQPTLLEALASACAGRPPLLVERLILGGEALATAQLKRIGALLGADCLVTVNYSSTETMHVACFTASLPEMAALRRIPVGRALPSRRVVIVGTDGEPVAEGETGEIVVVSRYLALQLDGRSVAERFGTDQADPALRVYHTRDRGRFNEAGLLEHLGRMDRELKINGVRVDPLLIEAELERVPGVVRAVVFGLRDAHDQTRLIGCVQRDRRVGNGALRAALLARLPAAFVPVRWLDIETFPIGPAGKLDLQALQARCASELQAGAAGGEGAESPLRALLREQWSKALRRPVAEGAGSFFEEGGDSLAAAVLLTALGELGADELGTLWVAQHPTLAAQEQALSSRAAAMLAGAAPHQPQAAAARNAGASLDQAEILRRVGWV